MEYLSHELKTPIACSLILLQQLSQLNLPPEAINYIELLACQLKFMMHLLDDATD